MSNINFDDLEPLDCPLTVQPTDDVCTGDLIKTLAYNLAILERALLKSVVPAGVIHFFSGGLEDRPKGFLIADGSWYDPSTYPALFSAIKYRYGKRNDDCFRVPDLRGTQIVGSDLGKNIIIDKTDYSGYDTEGNLKYGDIAGSSKNYCKKTNDGESCESTDKQTLLIPLISTGELCL